jgi:hypothetical protein
MSNLLMRAAVKTWFTFTGREKVSMQIQKSLDKYLFHPSTATQSVKLKVRGNTDCYSCY